MERPENEPVPPKPASTVILMKEEDNVLRVYLLRRSPKSLFMPGLFVFPGGAVEKEDEDFRFWKTRTDLDNEGIIKHLGGDIPVEKALAHGVAAIRETFEEAGVFPGPIDHLQYEKYEEILRLRNSGSLSNGWLNKWIGERKRPVPISVMRWWSHWITPVNSPIRFDTRFFVTHLHDGQGCVPDFKETTEGIWVSPEEGLTGNASREIPLSPPTLTTLQEFLSLLGKKQLKKALENREWGKVIMPRQIMSGMKSLLLLPWDPEYRRHGKIDMERFKASPLPPGEPFSRLHYERGMWRPVEA